MPQEILGKNKTKEEQAPLSHGSVAIVEQRQEKMHTWLDQKQNIHARKIRHTAP